jgi:parallel beta-helix repeat protein
MPTPTTSIDALPAKVDPTGSELLIVQDAGITKKMVITELAEMPSSALTNHLSDTTDAHDASAVSATDSGTGIDGVTVQAQLGQLATRSDASASGLAEHLADDGDAHDASAISTTVSGPGIDAPDVQGQLGQLATAINIKDVMWVGPDAPTDPVIEMWWDENEPSAYLPVGVEYATNAETIAGTLANKAVSPASLKASQPFYDVRTYGVVGDGVVDDAAALTTALTAAAGRTLVIPPPLIVRSSTTQLVPANTRITGGGTLAFDYKASGDLNCLHVNAVAGVTIEDIHIDMPNAVARGGNYGLIRATDATELHIVNCEIKRSQGTGIHLINCNGVVIRDCDIHDTWADGILPQRGCRNLIVTNNHIHATGDDCIAGSGYIQSSDGSINYGPIQNYVIAGNTLESGTHRGIRIGGVVGATIVGNTIRSCSEYGIVVITTEGTNPATAEHICKNVVIADNVVASCGAVGPLSGIRISYVRHVTVRGNVVTNSGSAGIQVERAVKDCHIIDNLVSDSGLRGIQADFAATSTDARVLQELYTDYGESVAQAGIDNLTINANTVHRSNNDGVRVAGSASWQVTNLVCRFNRVYQNNTSNTASTRNLVVRYTTDADLRDNQYGPGVFTTTDLFNDNSTRVKIDPAKATTALRPAFPTTGQLHFDTTLNAGGKPIWYSGTAWVDSTGATV